MDDEHKNTAREIVRRYLLSGISARMYRGGVVVQREGGWDGPFDPELLQKTYLQEIERLEEDARITVIAEIRRRNEGRRESGLTLLSKGACLCSPFVEIFLRESGYEDSKAKLYASIARHLYLRGELLR